MRTGVLITCINYHTPLGKLVLCKYCYDSCIGFLVAKTTVTTSAVTASTLTASTSYLICSVITSSAIAIMLCAVVVMLVVALLLRKVCRKKPVREDIAHNYEELGSNQDIPQRDSHFAMSLSGAYGVTPEPELPDVMTQNELYGSNAML